MSASFLTDLLCPECGRHFDADQIQTYCSDCRSPLAPQYDLAGVRSQVTRQEVSTRKRGIWRWMEILPVRDAAFRMTLGEGDTPLVKLNRSARRLGMTDLFVKDESSNPTGSFKARGLVMAVARALELGVRAFVIPTAGNAGGALAAYAAHAGLEAHIFMPVDTPRPIQLEVAATGAELRLVDGLINDAARLAAEEAKLHGWFDVSTFKEPYRMEGKKTMGLELAESFGWELPDVIVYPTGGGTGLVGMWKAFDELEKLGWIGPGRPRMVSVQAEGCAPVVHAFKSGSARMEVWQNAHTTAFGLRVPAVFADRMILRALAESKGTAIAVSDEEIGSAQKRLAAEEGIFAAPEGAATIAALEKLLDQGWIQRSERVVLFNTGSGLKYL